MYKNAYTGDKYIIQKKKKSCYTFFFFPVQSSCNPKSYLYTFNLNKRSTKSYVVVFFPSLCECFEIHFILNNIIVNDYIKIYLRFKNNKSLIKYLIFFLNNVHFLFSYIYICIQVLHFYLYLHIPIYLFITYYIL